MPFFTAAIAAVATFFSVSTAFASFALSAALSIGLSYAAKALSGDSAAADTSVNHFSLQGTLSSGGTVPRSFNLGYSATAGSLVYANTWGNDGETPNAYFTQVIALSDLPGGTLLELWINGELCTLGPTADANLGFPVTQYYKDGKDHLWVKYYDGTQTTADAFLQTKVASTDRPYPSTRIGTGIAYVICTALVDDTLFTGFPTYKFAVSGIPLYDPSKDDTAGGSGSHRWSDRTTWGGDGDNLPAVQIYNLLRGVSYNGQWLYGLQSMVSARLPSVNWLTQIAKCRATIQGETGLEPTYRSGGQISVDAPIANAVEALLTACQGRVSEIGGFYKIHLGTPDSPTFSWTDGDLLSTEEQTYKPFFGLADSINGITASYPYPGEAWAQKVAPPYYRSDLETRDGSRRLLANPSFDMVPYSAQVQRLMRSALDEAQRARTHVLAFPPQYWIVEPGDVGTWTSFRNGYTDKLFRADAGTDKYNLDVILHVTEIDPADYDWNHNTDFQGFPTGPTVFPRPAPQGIRDWFAEPYTIKDDDGLSRRPAIRLSWDGTMPGVAGVAFAVRKKSDQEMVHQGRTDFLSAGAIIISQNLLPNFQYQAQGQYIPSAPRDVTPSDWLDVTTPNALLSIVDFDAALKKQVTEVQDYLNDKIAEIDQRIAEIVAQNAARTWLDKTEVRSQLSSRSGAAFAEISRVETVATSADAALASDITTVTATVSENTAQIIVNATAITTLSSSFSSYQTTVSATFDSVNASVTTNSTAIATLNGYAAAAYGVTLDVNGYATGFRLVNGGSGVSSFTVTVDKFQVAAPGIGGGAAVPIFTVANVNGVAKVGIRGDALFDGSVTASKISVGTLTAISAHFGNATVDGTLSGTSGGLVLSFTDDRIEIWGS